MLVSKSNESETQGEGCGEVFSGCEICRCVDKSAGGSHVTLGGRNMKCFGA